MVYHSQFAERKNDEKCAASASPQGASFVPLVKVARGGWSRVGQARDQPYNGAALRSVEGRDGHCGQDVLHAPVLRVLAVEGGYLFEEENGQPRITD